MPARPWTVLKPSPLTQRGPNLWTIDDDIPGLAGVNRRMTVVKRADGTLLFFNAVPMPDATLAQLRAMGTPTALVLPNRYHALDAAAFAQKLNVTTFMPDVALPALAPMVTGRSISELPPGDDVTAITLESFHTREVALVVGKTLVVGDVVSNVPHGRGLRAWLMKTIGFTGPVPRLPAPAWKRVGRDRALLGRELEALAQRPLDTLIPSHGEVFTGDVAGALRHIAAGL